MWYLVNAKGERLYLKPTVEVTFGRKKADVLFPDDESISRLHASICVTPKQIFEMGETTSTCRLKDLGSKYGTYICQENEMMAVSKDGYNLKPNDRVRLGLQNNIFLVVNTSIITVTSCLIEEDGIKLKSLMDHIDGAILNNWLKCCTHLTVTKATLTEKVTCAMASAIPIVTVNYWKRVKVAIENGEELPDAKQFIPLISEPFVNKEKLLISPDKKRTTLFQNLIFVLFSTQQYKIYGKIIQLAGGKSLLYSKKRLSTKELCAPNVVVLQYPNNEATQSTQNISPEYDLIYNVLQANNRKMVPEFEIPLAILHCSTDKYCNPLFKFSKLLKRSQTKCDSSEVLVLDTQDAVPNVKVLSNVLSNTILKSEVDAEYSNNRTEAVSEVCDEFNKPDSTHQDSVRKSKDEEKLNELNYIEETNDCSVDTLAVEETVDATCVKENSHYIPETNESELLNTSRSSESIQCFVDDTENVKILENNELKEQVEVIKEIPVTKVIDESINESFELEDAWFNENINANSTKICMRKKSNDLFEIDNSEDEDLEVQIVKSSSAERDVQEIREDDENLKTVKIVGRNKTESQNYRYSSKYSDDLEKSTSIDKSDVEYKINIRQNNSSNCVNQENSSTLSKSWFLRVNPGRKTFIKVFNRIPEKRITLSDMCVWDESMCSKKFKL
ncbi:unnamed protein product [Xylocopa violacea]|uniref:FHA domain-containing protein n=1 Tax=Xylocopa violacea TaxID=135666 RepID=A0ABP1N0L2_XYLVO